MAGERYGAGADQNAQADALHLRERYGAKAEAWCEAALAGLPASAPRRAWVLMIALALQAIPAEQSANARICVQQERTSSLSVAEP